MRRHNFEAAADDDSLPVMVPRNDKAAVPMSPERVRRLRKHLGVLLRALRTMSKPEHSVSPLLPEPEGFAGRVARTACSLCKGSCCENGKDHAFLDEGTMARVRRATALDGRAVLRLYVERVPEVGYKDSCIFHGKRGCALDRPLRSDVCNSYFCGGLQGYMTGGDTVTPAMIIAGVGEKMRTSPILMPLEIWDVSLWRGRNGIDFSLDPVRAGYPGAVRLAAADEGQVRTGLHAGGKRIRTRGPGVELRCRVPISYLPKDESRIRSRYEPRAYVNAVDDAISDDDERVKSAYGANFERLTSSKTRYDPTNLFRLNANIRPSL
jgi:hypothetical protein